MVEKRSAYQLILRPISRYLSTTDLCYHLFKYRIRNFCKKTDNIIAHSCLRAKVFLKSLVLSLKAQTFPAVYVLLSSLLAIAICARWCTAPLRLTLTRVATSMAKTLPSVNLDVFRKKVKQSLWSKKLQNSWCSVPKSYNGVPNNYLRDSIKFESQLD